MWALASGCNGTANLPYGLACYMMCPFLDGRWYGKTNGNALAEGVQTDGCRSGAMSDGERGFQESTNGTELEKKEEKKEKCDTAAPKVADLSPVRFSVKHNLI